MFLTPKGFETRLESRLKAFGSSLQSKCASAMVDHHLGACELQQTVSELLGVLRSELDGLAVQISLDAKEIWSVPSRRQAVRSAAIRIAEMKPDLARLLNLEAMQYSPIGKVAAIRRAEDVLTNAVRELDPSLTS